jgi:2-oxo-3-hexenedioate decarboxylase
MNALTELQAIALEALAALDTGRQIEPFSSRTSSFSLDDAYRVTAAVRKIREARGN